MPGAEQQQTDKMPRLATLMGWLVGESTDRQDHGAAWHCCVSQVHFFVARTEEVTDRQTWAQGVDTAVAQGVDTVDRLTDVVSGSRRQYQWDAQQKGRQKLGAQHGQHNLQVADTAGQTEG